MRSLRATDLLRCVTQAPDAAFEELPDFPWEPAYAQVADPDGGTLRMAYVEAGAADGPVALLLHGEPSWSFLYRHVVRVLIESGIRCVLPDLVGFGRSDKPVRRVDYSYAQMVEWIRELVVDHLDLREVSLVGQDWGGLMGLRLVAEHPDRFTGVVAANTGLPTGDFDMPELWWQFRRAVEEAEVLDIGRLVAAGCVHPMAIEVRAAYDAPFPEERAKAGARALPALVPTRPDDPASEANRAAWEVLSASELPFLVAFSDSDPITGAMAPILRQLLPGTHGLTHPTIRNAGHFLQEDAGEGRAVADFVQRRPARARLPPPTGRGWAGAPWKMRDRGPSAREADRSPGWQHRRPSRLVAWIDTLGVLAITGGLEPILPLDAVSLGPVPEQTPTGGEGIPAEQMLRVFQRFHRGDTAGKWKHRGSGNGLTGSRIIVDTPGGSPSAFSDWVRRGATFEMRLPLDPQEAP